MLMVNQLVGFGAFAAAAGGYTYFRLAVTLTQDGTFVKLGEIEILVGGVDQIPTMTGTTTSGCTMTADNAANGAAWQAGNNATGAWQPVTAVDDHTLQIQFSSPVSPTQYSLQDDNTGGQHIAMPKSWTFDGSNDGSSWTNLNTQTSVANWSANEKRTYSI